MRGTDPSRFAGQHFPGDSRQARTLWPAAIVAATFLAYVATLDFGFVFDDHVLILANDSIRSWRYFPSYFSSHIWSFTYPHLLANYYRPFFLTWLRLNDALFGLHAWGWHLTSLLAHVAVTYLVYRLCLALTREVWIAGTAGLLFGLHPVHVEAVADVTSIQEPLATFFILGAVLTYRRSRNPRGNAGWLAASVALAAAALLSKESGLVLPILIGGLAWIYGPAPGAKVAAAEQGALLLPRLRYALGASIPFWAVVLIYLPVRMRALRGFAHVVTSLSLAREVFTIPSVLLFYWRVLVWPLGLSCYYDTPYVAKPGWGDFVLPLAVVAAVVAGLIFWYRRTARAAPLEAKAIAFACLWMLVTLLPVLNFRLLPEGEIAHDRYVYLPSVGFVLLVAIAVRQGMRAAARSFGRSAWLVAALLLSCAMGYSTVRQSLYWSDDLSLNYRAHEIAPNNVSATTSLAAAVAQRGMDNAAMALYQQALAVRPELWQANVNLAYLYYAHGNFPEAARYFARSCAADPADGDQFLYLGMSLLRMGRRAEAENAVRTALIARPWGKNYHLGLAMVLKEEGRLTEARREVLFQLAEDPGSSQARNLLDEITANTPTSAGKPSPESDLKGASTHVK